MENHGTKHDLENGPKLKRVKAQGKTYVYVAGTDIAVVRAFVGSDADLDALISRNLQMPLKRRRNARSLLVGWREDAAKAMHKTTSGRASAKGRAYTLTIQSIVDMLVKAKDRCQVTGLPFDYCDNDNPDWRTNPMGPSLDRINNRRGYERGNVRVVCTSVNFAINEFGLEHFEKICRAFVERNPS